MAHNTTKFLARLRSRFLAERAPITSLLLSHKTTSTITTQRWVFVRGLALSAGLLVKHSYEEWRAKLTPEQYYVCRQKGTEPPWSGELNASQGKGIYQCVCCGTDLFSSSAKFDTGSGWPSFYDVLKDNENSVVKEVTDKSHGMVRVEVLCREVFSKLVRFQPEEQNMSKEAKKEVVVCDGKDQDNTTKFVYICSVYQGGEVDGHYLKFKDNKLISTAAKKDRSKIKLETFIDDDGIGELCLIIDPNNTDRALKSNIKDDGTSSFTVEQNSKLASEKKSYTDVKQHLAAFLFKKKQQKNKKDGDSGFYLYSNETNRKKESLVLAVDEGSDLKINSQRPPPEIREVELLMKDESKYLFRIH